MKKLDVQARLEYARCAVAVLRALKILDKKLTYQDLGRAIGLIADGDNWAPWHRQQIQDILNAAAAVERGSGNTDTDRLEYDRIINRRTGQPGEGIAKSSRITRQQPAA